MRIYRNTVVTLVLILMIGCGVARQPSKEELQTAEYFRTLAQITEEFQKVKDQLKVEVDRDSERFNIRQKEDPYGARLELAASNESVQERLKPMTSRIEQLTPPEKLRSHHKALLDCAKSQENQMGKMAEALRRYDDEAFRAAKRIYQESIRDCPDQISSELRKAGYNSVEDVKDALAPGR